MISLGAFRVRCIIPKDRSMDRERVDDSSDRRAPTKAACHTRLRTASSCSQSFPRELKRRICYHCRRYSATTDILYPSRTSPTVPHPSHSLPSSPFLPGLCCFVPFPLPSLCTPFQQPRSPSSSRLAAPLRRSLASSIRPATPSRPRATPRQQHTVNHPY